MNIFAIGEGVANDKVAGVGNADNVSRERLVDDLFLRSHKSGRARNADGFSGANVFIHVVPHKHTGAYFHKSNTAAVVRVDVGVDFKNKS